MENCIGQNIRMLRAHKGLSQEGLGNILGVSQTAMSAWEDGTSIPRKANASKIFEAFPELTHDDIFSDKLGFARMAIRRKAGNNAVEVPLLGTIAAGSPLEMVELEESMLVPEQIRCAHPRSFLLRVSGESMNRRLPNGCIALIDPDVEIVSGKMYAVRVGESEATIKIVQFKNDAVELVPCSYDPRFKKKKYVRNEDGDAPVRIMGGVVWYFAPFDLEKQSSFGDVSFEL